MTIEEARALVPLDVQKRLAAMAREFTPSEEQLDLVVRLFARPAREMRTALVDVSR